MTQLFIPGEMVVKHGLQYFREHFSSVHAYILTCSYASKYSIMLCDCLRVSHFLPCTPFGQSGPLQPREADSPQSAMQVRNGKMATIIAQLYGYCIVCL